MACDRKAMKIVGDHAQLRTMHPNERSLRRHAARQRNGPASGTPRAVWWPDLIGHASSGKMEVPKRRRDGPVIGMRVGHGGADEHVQTPAPTDRPAQPLATQQRLSGKATVRQPQKGHAMTHHTQTTERRQAFLPTRRNQPFGGPCPTVGMRGGAIADHDDPDHTALPPQGLYQASGPDDLVIGMGCDDDGMANGVEIQFHRAGTNRPCRTPRPTRSLWASGAGWRR